MQEQVFITHLARHGTGWDATVEIGEQSDQSTTHNVTVDDDFYQRLTNGESDIETLVEEAFKFLLEREDKEQIMPNFDLETIATYFEGFEENMIQRLTNR